MEDGQGHDHIIYVPFEARNYQRRDRLRVTDESTIGTIAECLVMIHELNAW